MNPLILDVRILEEIQKLGHESRSEGLREQIFQGLNKPSGKKTIPTMVLYDELGLRLYDKITTNVPEYYLFSAEEEILRNKSDEIVRAMHFYDTEEGRLVRPVVLELGAGALRKTSHILLALSRIPSGHKLSNSGGYITYYALDLEKRELERTLTELMEAHSDQLQDKVDVRGMWGTYDGGLKFVQEGGLDKETKRELDEASAKSSGNEGELIEDQRSGIPTPRGRTIPRRRESSVHSAKSDLWSSSVGTAAVSVTPPSSPGSEPESCNVSPPLHIMFLGSSLGNFDRESATSFLRSLPLRPGSSDTLLIGLDHDNTKEQIELAYNDPRGVTREFIMNGLRSAGKVLGQENLFDSANWEYVNFYNEKERRHEAYYRSTKNQSIQVPGLAKSIEILSDEMINIEISLKFSDTDAYSMFTSANLRPIMRWTDAPGKYSLWLLERPPFTFPLLKSPSPFGIPSLDDFRDMWKAWDLITLGMIPRNMLFQKPIDLRHICLFYLGHIPAFLDIHLSRLLEEPHTKPEYFKDIFERGIDPHVDDPNQCHPHSEVPQNDEDWPILESIVTFRDSVRARLTRLYKDLETGKRQLTRKIGRVLFMTFEHEGFHAETLLYMLLQSAGIPGGTVSPPGFAIPSWDILARQWDESPQPDSLSVSLGPVKLSIGHNDPEDLDEDPERRTNLDNVEFGWDNEHPKREVHLNEFRIEWRPVTNDEFYKFYTSGGRDLVSLPASWIVVGEEIKVRTLYGHVAMNIAKHWPVLTSYDDLSKYAQVKGGRLPTEAELRLFFDKFESGYAGGSNVGFRNWHPVPATTGLAKNFGKGHNGGVWEWTSTVLDKYEGFQQSKLYPGYSTDFFDGKHQVVVGGSYATIPRLAERRTLRNYYQHNYPYPWVAGRVAYDVNP